jgi:hypothetical protein
MPVILADSKDADLVSLSNLLTIDSQPGDTDPRRRPRVIALSRSTRTDEQVPSVRNIIEI